MKQRARLAALLVALAGTALNSQNPPPSPQTPTFRVNVEYVEVDALVTDRDGQFVRGLGKDDFQILEDGKPQAIATFSIVDIPVERLQRPLNAREPVEPDVRSNERPFDGRIYVMVIDDLHTYFGRTPRVRAAARQFIQQYLGANDLMAVVHTAGPSDASQEFTSNKGLLIAAVNRTNGRKLTSATLAKTDEALRGNSSSSRAAGEPVTDPEDAQRQANARQSLDTLRNVAEWFSTVRGRRKAILYVSEGIDYDITDFGNPGSSMIISSTRDTLAAAARGNVSIYGIDPRGLTNLSDETIEVQTFLDDSNPDLSQQPLRKELFLSQSSLRELSDQTGGFAVTNANDFTNAFDRIVRDSSSYYAMAYYPPSDKAGSVHKIEVRVRRPDLRVRARQGYVTPKPPPPVNAKSVPGAKSLATPKLTEAFDSPLPVSGLGLKVFASPFKGTPPNASVLLGFELRGRDLRMDSTDKVVVTYAVVDTQGKIRAGASDALSMALRPETKTRVASSGLRILKRVEVPPGRYQLRVAAHDQGGGNVGSVVYDLDVPDFAKAPFSMSGVALTSATAVTEPTVKPDESLQQVMPGPPVAARSFPQNDQVAVFVEVYDNQLSKPHKVDITTTITSDDGKVVFKTEEARDSSELQGRGGGYGHAARVSLKDFAPGFYVLTVSARSRLADTAPVERQVPFTITGVN